MKTFLRSRDRASKGAALMVVLAFVVLLTGLALAYFTRAGTDRQLAQSSYNDTSADLLARTALDIVVNDFKQEILNDPTVTRANIQPARYGDAGIPNLIRRSFSGDPTNRTSSVPSTNPSANGRSISLARWNSHYLIPRDPNLGDNTIDSTPVLSFSPGPNWVLITPQGPAPAPSPNTVIGRYAFAVYDEGGLLDMNLAGYPSWSGLPNTSCSPNPSPTPWLVNVGRKGIMAFADLTTLPWPGFAPSPSTRIDHIVGWRNYAMTQRTFTGFPSPSPSPVFGGETDCAKQNWYGSYLLYFGDPPFSIESLSDKLLASTYPFTSAAAYVSNNRTDQVFMSREELLRLVLALGSSSSGYNQNVLQYMGTFSRERNQPAPDWPNLSGNLSEGRFNLNNLALVVPNPGDCNIQKGKKRGWQTGKNRNHICGTPNEIIELFGLFWVKAEAVQNCPVGNGNCPGYWRYVDHTGPNPPGDPDPNPHSVICFRGANQQADFFQVLHYALGAAVNQTNRCGGTGNQARTFGIGASLIDQYDSGTDCLTTPWGPGCDLDSHVVNGNGGNLRYATHTTVIEYGQGNGSNSYAYGMEPNYDSHDPNASVNGDDPWSGDCNHNQSGNNPHRPCNAPAPPGNTQVISHAFSNVGELGYGINTALGGPTPGPTPLPTLDFGSPNFPDAPVLDFFSYNPISSAYPRAGIVNLYTKNAPVIAAMLAGALKTDAAAANPAPTPVVTASQAMDAATRIVQETQNVLAGSPGYGPVTQTDMTRAIAARLVAAGAAAPSWSGSTTEQKQSIARALAEMGQTRTWNLFVDVIAQTGRYAPDAADINQANKFIVEGEKRYWLHIALGRDLVHTDGTPCLPGDTGCQVDVLGSQLEEVTE